MNMNILSQDTVTGGVEVNVVAESVESGVIDSNNENREFEAKSDINGSSFGSYSNITNEKQKIYLKMKSRYKRIKHNAMVAKLQLLQLIGEYLKNNVTGENAESEIKYISFVSGVPRQAIINSIEIAKKFDSSERFQLLLNYKSVSYGLLIKSLKFEVQDIELIFQTSRTKSEALKKYKILDSTLFPKKKDTISAEPINAKPRGGRRKKEA